MGRSHSTTTMQRARDLHRAGFKCGEISKLLKRELGVAPHEVTIRRWVDPDYAEAQRQVQRTGAARTRQWGWRNRRNRARDLHRAGLAYADIAKVFALDFGLSLSTGQVEQIVAAETPSDVVQQIVMETATTCHQPERKRYA